MKKKIVCVNGSFHGDVVLSVLIESEIFGNNFVDVSHDVYTKWSIGLDFFQIFLQ